MRKCSICGYTEYGHPHFINFGGDRNYYRHEWNFENERYDINSNPYFNMSFDIDKYSGGTK